MTPRGASFQPDFAGECRQCGTGPTVIVYDPEHRRNSETDLCGVHFFNDRQMVDWEEWNNQPEDTE